MKVAILNYEGAISSSITGPYDILSGTNNILQLFGIPNNKIVFEVDIVNSSKIKSSSLASVTGNKIITNKKIYDLVIIPAMDFEYVDKVLINEQKMVNWIKQQYKSGSEIASICMGTFLLAATGLIDGKKATTHWMGVPLFKKLFPLVSLEDDKVIIDEGSIYSCGAAFSFTSLMVYLVEKFCGHEAALAVSKVFMIQIHDSGQHSFTIFELQKGHQDKDIKRIQDFIERNYSQELYVKKLAERFHMSNRTFIRRFSTATGNTPLEYIQRVRIEAAKRLLEKGKEGVEQVCIKSGYEDFNFFRKVFRRYTGLSPKEYRYKYGNMFKGEIFS
jgi:transcriptional regulator GlxA family with amidase domain